MPVRKNDASSNRRDAFERLVAAPFENDWVRLQFIEEDFVPDLDPIGADEQILTYMPALPGRGLTYKAHQAHILAEAKAGRMAPFVVYDSQSGKWVGGATYAKIDRTHRCLGIDYIWLESAYRTSTYHLAIQALLIERAVAWGAKRLEWRIDDRNSRAMAAIQKTGAMLEGVLRAGQRMANGDWADVAVFSMIGPELSVSLEKVRSDLKERAD